MSISVVSNTKSTDIVLASTTEAIITKLSKVTSYKSLNAAVRCFTEDIISAWIEDGALGDTYLENCLWKGSLEPILSEAGINKFDLSMIWDILFEASMTASNYRNMSGMAPISWYDEENEQVVPIENPIQMHLSPLSKDMANGSGKVSLDWLSNKRVVPSQVDKGALHRSIQRHRQRAEKRGLKMNKSSALEDSIINTISNNKSDEDELGLSSLNPLIDPQLIVDTLIAEYSDTSNSIIMDDGIQNSTRKNRDLILEGFDISVGGKRILTNASLHMAYGRRYGLVGRNGVGKSTLLRHIAARRIPGIPAGMSILHVEQEVVGDEQTVLASVLAADFKREALMQEEIRIQSILSSLNSREAIGIPSNNHMQQNEKTLSARLSAIWRILHEEIDASSAEARASIILTGLGFSPSDQARPTREFSGGWRMRVALARALFCQPDLLLLDEPTNMLDFPTVVWLEKFLNGSSGGGLGSKNNTVGGSNLSGWNGTLLVVSHDRCFLDNVATDIIHLQGASLDAYRGDYATFLSTRQERQRNKQREYEAQLQYRAHLQAFVDRWRYNANRASQAQSRLKILEKLPELKPVIVEAPVVLRFPIIDSLSPPILQLDEVYFRYGTFENGENPLVEQQPWILQGVNFNVQPGSRIAIVGPNGSGKTTLLKLLSGQLEPTKGRIYRHGRLRLGLFSQHHVEQIDLNQSPLSFLQSIYPGKTEEEYRHALGSFGLSGPLALQTIRTLSGGQKSRVVFCCIYLERPHVLILDEPTNHLDMDSIEALIKAIKEFNGGVVIVSHDKKFVDEIVNYGNKDVGNSQGKTGEIWVCSKGRVQRWDSGNIYDYAKSLLTARDVL